MKILIADDDARRAEELRTYLAENSSYAHENIHLADCFDEAKRNLSAIYYDVLILDVVLPKRRGEAGDSRHSLSLIDQLSRESFLKKPEKIIGITAHISDIANFRTKFEDSCLVVIEATPGSNVWRVKIASSLTYTGASKFSRTVIAHHINVITVHGIQTFGQWQSKLRQLVEKHTGEVSFHTYKYGYFPLLYFIVPFLRTLEVRKLCRHVHANAHLGEKEKLFIFSHSFGTLLVARAIKRLVAQGVALPNMTIIFSGSVLKSNHDWSFLSPDQNIKIINDCGADDNVLLLSEALVIGTGMAGRAGFNGFAGRKIVNRYFRGGHSHYFFEDSFINEQWLPLLVDDALPADVDQRPTPTLMDSLITTTVVILGSVKGLLYLILAALLLYALNSLR